jgi:hypothetical protein
MARFRVADGGDGHQIWMVAANILNTQLRTAGKVWSSSLGRGGGVGRGANNSSPKKKRKLVMKMSRNLLTTQLIQKVHG